MMNSMEKEKSVRKRFFYEGYFRRFIEKEKLISKLKTVGFHIDYEAEERFCAARGI